MRILMITQWFNPEPTFKGLIFAKELVRRGHQVQVLTGFPNYPGGRVYPGYRIRFFQREVMDGIPVLRVPLYPSHDSSGFRRMLNYVSFALSAAVLGTLLAKKADIAYVYHPPATVGLAAVVIGFFRRIPFVYDIQDLWPDTLGATGMMNNAKLLKIVGAWCSFVYRRASHITVLSPGFKRLLVERGVPEQKIDVIYNWTEEQDIYAGPVNEQLAREMGFEGFFNVVFAGTMGKAQALDAVLEAAAIIEYSAPKVRLVFIGGGIDVDRLKDRVRQMGLKNVVFFPRRPVSEIGEILNLADVLLVHLKDDPLFEITIPSKTQAYMASGKPVLLAVRGDAARLVEESGGGIACKPEDPQAIASSIEKLYNMKDDQRIQMGKLGRKYYMEHMSLAKGCARFEGVFSDVLQRKKALKKGKKDLIQKGTGNGQGWKSGDYN